MANGDTLQGLRRAAQSEGPSGDMARKALREIEESGACPELSPYEIGFWIDFGNLTGERQLGHAAGPIPYLKIVAYADHNNLSVLQTDILIRVIKAMDTAWLNAVADKQAKASK